MPDNNKVLVVTQDPGRGRDLCTILEFLGEEPVAGAAPDLEQAFSVALVCGDHRFTESSLEGLSHRFPELPVLLVDGPAAGELAKESAARVIARLEWPLNYAKLVDSLHRAQVYRSRFEPDGERGRFRKAQLFRSLVGTSRRIQEVRELMARVAEREATVLVSGEPGTGKEVVARNLHYHSPRRDKPFVPVHCSAIAPELLEAELFGYEQGAFPGALVERAGRCELAGGGTLFLDDVGALPLNTQVRVLRLLQERTFERLGSSSSRTTDIRVIAAAGPGLERKVEAGQFREDLFYRLNVFPIDMPPLRDRVEDIPLLINELLSRLEHEKRGSLRMNSAAIMSLCRHDWPGNMRELANLIERLAILYPFSVIGVKELPRKFRYLDSHDENHPAASPAMPSFGGAVAGMEAPVLLPVNGLDLKEYLATLERQLIEQALNEASGVVARAAEKLRIRRTTLVEKVRKYGLREEV